MADDIIRNVGGMHFNSGGTLLTDMAGEWDDDFDDDSDDDFDDGEDSSAALQQIEALEKEHLPGSESYKSEAVQDELNRLYKLAYPDDAAEPPAEGKLEQSPDITNPPEPVDGNTVENATAILQQTEKGQTILKEWGSGLADNLGYVKAAMEHVAEHYPGVLEKLEASNDDPELIRIASEYGRLIAHRDGTEVSPLTSRPQKETPKVTEQPTNPLAPETREEAIYDQIRAIEKDNPIGSERYLSPRIQKKVQALYAQLGDEPIVGGLGEDGQRTA